MHPRVPERHRTRFGLGGRRTGQVDKAKHAATADGSGHRPTGTRDARHRGDRRDELMKEGNAIGRIDGRARHVHVDNEYAVGIEPKGQRREPFECPHQKARRHDEHHRQRHLGDDEAALTDLYARHPTRRAPVP